jgi:hypothetical protein
MNAAELKLWLFRKIDSLDRNKLEEIYGILTNYLNGQKALSDWTDLTDEQKQGIYDAIEELESGKGIPHEQVVSEIRKKYSDA